MNSGSNGIMDPGFQIKSGMTARGNYAENGMTKGGKGGKGGAEYLKVNGPGNHG